MNLLKFAHLPTKDSTINSGIRSLEIGGYHYNVDELLVDYQVFEQLEFISLEETIGSLKEDFFKSFKYLINFQLFVTSLRDFYHKIGISWTYVLNNGTSITFAELHHNILGELNYAYPDEDFCLFAHFPFDRNIKPPHNV